MSAGSSDDGASDVLLGQLLQHYVEDMTNFQAEVISEDEYFNREEQCVDRLECIKQTIEGDSEEIKICVNRAHTLIEFLHTTEDFPEKYQIGMITAGILSTQTMLQTLSTNATHLDFFMTFLDRQAHQWDEVQASQWARVATSLVASHLPRTFFADNDHLYLKKLLTQIASPSVHNFLEFLVGVEPETDRASLLPFYVVETNLVPLLVGQMLTKVPDDEFQINSCKLLCQVVGAFSSLPSFSSRFHAKVKPAIESLLEVALAADAPKQMCHQVLRLLTELVQYDLRAAKYAALCGRDAQEQELPPFFQLALSWMHKVAEFLESNSLVLWRSLGLVRVLVSSDYEQVLQSMEAHDILGRAVEAFFSDRSSEFARHEVLSLVKSALRGTCYHSKMLLVESSSLLSGLPNAYRNLEQVRRQASLGHIGGVLTEVLIAASRDNDVACVVDAHAEWSQIRSRYPSPALDENELGLGYGGMEEMLTLFGPGDSSGNDELAGLVSPPRAPMRTFASPGLERTSVTPESSPSQGAEEEDDICLDSATHRQHEVDDEDAATLRYQDCEEEPTELEHNALLTAEENDEVMLVQGMEQVEVGGPSSSNSAEPMQLMATVETPADMVHPRTPIGGARPKRNLTLDGLATALQLSPEADDKENDATMAEDEDSSKAESGNTATVKGKTPKKKVHSDGGYKTVAGSSDTPKPKIKPQSRTYYSRAAKSKSPFAVGGESGGKTKTRVGTPIAGPRTGSGMQEQKSPSSAEKMPVKRLF